jgi:hypothetical protein
MRSRVQRGVSIWQRKNILNTQEKISKSKEME